jgi:hypothetical protein
MFDDVIVVYKFIGDLMFFVTGANDENELILYTVLQAFYESVSLLLRYVPRQPSPRVSTPYDWAHSSGACPSLKHPLIQIFRDAVEKKTVLENLDLVLLAMDEIIDGGYVWSLNFWALGRRKLLNVVGMVMTAFP